MFKSNEKIYYSANVYNNYIDMQVAVDDLEFFSFDKLLYNPNPRVREFSFIEISKCIENEKGVTIKPLIIIYNKNIWDIEYDHCKTWCGHKKGITTKCWCNHHSIGLQGKVIKVPCNNQEEIITRLNIIAKILVAKRKILYRYK